VSPHGDRRAAPRRGDQVNQPACPLPFGRRPRLAVAPSSGRLSAGAGAPAWTVLALGLLLLLAACARPVGVTRVEPETAQRSLTANVLSTGAPSMEARNVLQEEGLAARFDAEPEAALADLHQEVVSGRRGPSAVYALAELSYLHADRTGQRPHYLAAALYAWAYLFPAEPRLEPSPFDRRFRAAADLYNSALTGAFKSDDGERFEPRFGRVPTPMTRARQSPTRLASSATPSARPSPSSIRTGATPPSGRWC
jgi:hypothetical protein